MVPHLTAAGGRLRLEARVAVELSEKVANVGHPRRPHERLVPVVAGTPVAGAESLGHGELGDLFAIAKDPECGVATYDLSPTDDARPPAAVRQSVVGDDRFGGQGRLRVAQRF